MLLANENYAKCKQRKNKCIIKAMTEFIEFDSKAHYRLKVNFHGAAPPSFRDNGAHLSISIDKNFSK